MSVKQGIEGFCCRNSTGICIVELYMGFVANSSSYVRSLLIGDCIVCELAFCHQDMWRTTGWVVPRRATSYMHSGEELLDCCQAILRSSYELKPS